MKKLRLVFLGKSELLHQGNSTLIAFFGTPSLWRSKNDKFQKNYFRSKTVFFDLGETRILKKTDSQN